MHYIPPHMIDFVPAVNSYAYIIITTILLINDDSSTLTKASLHQSN